MPRESDPLWKYVQRGENGTWKCRFCGKESKGGATRIRAHLAGIPGKGIKGCEKVDHLVKAQALQENNGEGSMLDKSTGGTSGEGMEGIDFGASQSILPSDDASNPNDTQNWNQLGCAPQQRSFYLPTRASTAPACPEDQGSLPPHNIFPDILDNTQQSDPSNRRLDAAHGNEIAAPHQQPQIDWSALSSFNLTPSELLSPHPEFGCDVLPTPLPSDITTNSIPPNSNEQYPGIAERFANEVVLDSPVDSTENLHGSPPEYPPELPDAIANASEEIGLQEFTADVITPDAPEYSDRSNELHNPTVGSSLQIDPSLNVDGANRLRYCGQRCVEEVDPVRSNTCDDDGIHGSMSIGVRNGNRRISFPSSSSQAPDNALPPPQHLPGGTGLIGPSSLPDMYKGAPMTSHPNTRNNFEENRALKRKLELLYNKEADVRDELKFAASLFLKKPRKEVAKWLADVEKLRIDCPAAASEDRLPPYQQVDILMREAEDLSRQGKGLFEAREVTKLLEDKMVGEAFWRNAAKILEYLVGNKIHRLGIYGMGGVGKTTIMVHVHNILLEEGNYDKVLWITVSQDFNTQRLQDAIWKELDLGILQETDVRKRAAMLYDHLTKGGKSIIILDDVWECFDLKEVGIPIRADGIKLVLTTRSFEVCRQMRCQERIKIEPLSHIEAENLFMEELGFEVTLNWETEGIVKSIVEECAGLPLAIITMARSMQGVTDVFEWKDCLEKWRESDLGQTDVEKEVLMKLEFSYNRLGNHEVQQCFLSCALYPEDRLIDKVELIELFIDQGFIHRLNTREKQYDRGLTILNKLENVCLLEDHGRGMKMHDLIRDMALHIMSATSMVKARNGLKGIPSEEYWMDALEKVSLMENNIEEFPLNMSPNCPKLSTFLLNENQWYHLVIPDSFFKHLQGLKVLNLSGCTLRELPDSISNLVNLTALLLQECVELRRIPHLGKLKSLRKLDILNCFRVEALEGLDMLVNLRYLDISYSFTTSIKRLPKGTLGALLNLQCLQAELVNGEEITKLRALETLQCFFDDVDDFNKFVSALSKRGNNPRYYNIMVDPRGFTNFHFRGVGDQFQDCVRSVTIMTRSHAIVSARGESSGSGSGICILIPQDVRRLVAHNCDGATNLSDIGLLEKLEVLIIGYWSNLRVLCRGQGEEVIDIHDSPTRTPTPVLFRSLRNLIIYDCPKLKYLFGHETKFSLPHLRRISIGDCEEIVGITVVATSPPLYPPPAFPSLEDIHVEEGCHKMKRVLESEWLPHFPNLRRIEVQYCGVEEIIGGLSSSMSVEEISPERLLVKGCHELPLHPRNLETIQVIGCEGMPEMISGVGQGQEGSMTTPVNNTPSSSQSSISLPKLNTLCLHYLRQLKSICEVPITCSSMRHLKVTGCPKLNRIPLELQLRDIEDLPYIEVEGEEKWKTLIWDHPDAQAILQSHLLLRGNYCILKGKG